MSGEENDEHQSNTYDSQAKHRDIPPSARADLIDDAVVAEFVSDEALHFFGRQWTDGIAVLERFRDWR